jgi:L-ascorbate metabolism protein UlaG (beta-lactamase superfamily)
MAKLLFQGHGSFRITTDDNIVIYVDPYIGAGYDLPADIILVTHQHGDHNQIGLVTKKDDCRIIQSFDAIKDGIYQSFSIDNVTINAVPAYNKNHPKNQCVGYIIEFNGLKLYAAGDTSTTDEMKDFAELKLDYALLPIDGIYNMDAKEAASCAELIGVKHAIPIHMKPGALFDEQMAAGFNAKNSLIVRAGEEIIL